MSIVINNGPKYEKPKRVKFFLPPPMIAAAPSAGMLQSE